MRVTLVAGLPGSGKSSMLRKLAADGATCIDDIHALSELPPRRVRWLAVADVNFCRSQVRSAAEAEIERRYGASEIEWVFFANDPTQCLANASARNDGRDVAADIKALSRVYVIPDGAGIVSVYGRDRDGTFSGPDLQTP